MERALFNINYITRNQILSMEMLNEMWKTKIRILMLYQVINFEVIHIISNILKVGLMKNIFEKPASVSLEFILDIALLWASHIDESCINLCHYNLVHLSLSDSVSFFFLFFFFFFFVCVSLVLHM